MLFELALTFFLFISPSQQPTQPTNQDICGGGAGVPCQCQASDPCGASPVTGSM